MQLDRAAVGADRDEQGALQPLGAIFKWRAQTKRLDISRPTSILTREFVSLTIPLVMSSDATCPTPAEARSLNTEKCAFARASHILSFYRQRAPILTHFEASSPAALTEQTSTAPSCTPACRAQKLPKVRTVVLSVLAIVLSSSGRVPASMEATAP